MPIGLADDADSEARRFEHPAENRHREARVIDVGIAGHKDDVEFFPTALASLGHRHR